MKKQVYKILPVTEGFSNLHSSSSCPLRRTFAAFACSVVSDSFATLWTTARQASLSMGLPRQEHWSGLPFLLRGSPWPKARTPAFCTENQIYQPHEFSALQRAGWRVSLGSLRSLLWCVSRLSGSGPLCVPTLCPLWACPSWGGWGLHDLRLHHELPQGLPQRVSAVVWWLQHPLFTDLMCGAAFFFHLG